MIKLTKQEAFDAVARGILAQGKPAYDRSTLDCHYRSEDGCKCAAGHLIPDDLFDPDMEGHVIHDPIFDGIFFVDFLPFVDKLQVIHDTCARRTDNDEDFIEQFKMDMRVLADSHGLSTAVLDEGGVE